MRFYTDQHPHCCGIDLHTTTMYVCILDRDGQVVVHKNLPSNPEAFREVIAPDRDDLVVAVECIFTWYWLADLCAAVRGMQDLSRNSRAADDSPIARRNLLPEASRCSASRTRRHTTPSVHSRASS